MDWRSNPLRLTVAKSCKDFLCVIIGALSSMWVLWWIMFSEPPNKDTKYLQMLDKHIRSRFFRTDDYYGSALIYQSGPFILGAVLSYGVIELRQKIKLLQVGAEPRAAASSTIRKAPRPSLTTYPLLLQSPVGILSAAEVLFGAGLLFLILFSFGRPTFLYIHGLYSSPSPINSSLKLQKLKGASYYLGRAAIIPFSLLWIPISRGSPFLRLINVPFENAIKYHICLSGVALSMLTLHSIGYMLYYLLSHTPEKIIGWEVEAESCSVVAGLLAWIVGLTMWATSLSFVRRRWYELFFGVHHLYIVFLVLWLYHVMWTVHLIIIPCVLFAIDRFLRMVQSHQSVDVLLAKTMESGCIELKISRNRKSRGLGCHALSSWYLQCPSLPGLLKFQWHFLSAMSTGSDEDEALSIVIKPLGKWSQSLRKQVLGSTKGTNGHCTFPFQVAIEGPYGNESDFYLRYKVIILACGGIGITPLLSILQDILHRKRLQEDNLPSSIYLYHCVRKHEDLCVLNSVDPNLIVAQSEKDSLEIHVNAYVTSSSSNNVEEDCAEDRNSNNHSSTTQEIFSQRHVNNIFHSIPIHGVCVIGSTGKAKWLVLTVIASLLGFYSTWGLSNVLIVKKYNAHFPNYHRAHLVVASMALGTICFGGIIIMLWWSEWKMSLAKEADCASQRSESVLQSLPIKHQESAAFANKIADKPYRGLQENSSIDLESACLPVGSPWNAKIYLQCRPQWKDIFHNLSMEYQGQNIGMLVSGPPSMQVDIAQECRRHCIIFKRNPSSSIFHFHPISFDV